ncbi:MAG: MATE family efflux transporter [Candidatus Delongbacteria bacterium]|nr:MATE family efflux transporter [Candidatus Delongbacteria bacterium]MBN2836924.1 MATE family efflux transporter [Candidatus Delongbacteria bacterium]
MKKRLELEQKPIWKLLIKYSVPSIVASTIQSLYNIVDRIYIGKALGTEALAGVTLVFPIFILSIAIGVLIGSGSSATISLKLGEKKIEEAEQTLGNTFSLFMIAAVFVTIFSLFFLTPLLNLVGATEATFPYAYDYLIWFLPFIFFDFLAMGTNGCIRSEGNPNIAMLIAMSGAVLNIILDPIFLFTFNMGVSGVAMATAISRIVTSSLVFWYFTKSKRRVLTLRLRNLKISWITIKPMISIGTSPFLMNLATTLVTVLLNRVLIKNGGATALGALGAIHSIMMIIETLFFGLMMGSQPVIGYNYGAKLIPRVKEGIKFSSLYAVLVATLGLFTFYIFSDSLILVFSKNDMSLIELGSNGLRISIMMIPFTGLNMMIAMYFQAIGKPKESIIINLSRKVLIYIPALFILPTFFNLDGVWAATPTSELLGFSVVAFLLSREIKKLDKIERGLIKV